MEPNKNQISNITSSKTSKENSKWYYNLRKFEKERRRLKIFSSSVSHISFWTREQIQQFDNVIKQGV